MLDLELQQQQLLLQTVPGHGQSLFINKTVPYGEVVLTATALWFSSLTQFLRQHEEHAASVPCRKMPYRLDESTYCRCFSKCLIQQLN